MDDQAKLTFLLLSSEKRNPLQLTASRRKLGGQYSHFPQSRCKFELQI
jgi:hypothetical protein